MEYSLQTKMKITIFEIFYVLSHLIWAGKYQLIPISDLQCWELYHFRTAFPALAPQSGIGLRYKRGRVLQAPSSGFELGECQLKYWNSESVSWTILTAWLSAEILEIWEYQLKYWKCESFSWNIGNVRVSAEILEMWECQLKYWKCEGVRWHFSFCVLNY